MKNMKLWRFGEQKTVAKPEKVKTTEELPKEEEVETTDIVFFCTQPPKIPLDPSLRLQQELLGLHLNLPKKFMALLQA